MGTKHTPGAWRIGDAGTAVFAAKNGPVPKYVASDLNQYARLIASAPELLEALTHFLELDETRLKQLNATDWGKACLEQARAAIRKARGE